VEQGIEWHVMNRLGQSLARRGGRRLNHPGLVAVTQRIHINTYWWQAATLKLVSGRWLQ